MTQIPTFNILALGLKLETHKTIQGLKHPFQDTLHGVNFAVKISYPFNGMLSNLSSGPVYFAD